MGVLDACYDWYYVDHRNEHTSNVAISCRMSMTSRAALRRASAEAVSAGILIDGHSLEYVSMSALLFGLDRVAQPCQNALHVRALGNSPLLVRARPWMDREHFDYSIWTRES
jgi:hypothetical protein